ncbi:hypothetical protein ACHAW5_008817 [Stephanodiscus triporus]|uniref:Metalloendopeptidase n=1 Tax=Stephanodiscus triporus TaxID=2934178 RepID=A0ABD3MZT0_9STRA
MSGRRGDGAGTTSRSRSTSARRSRSPVVSIAPCGTPSSLPQSPSRSDGGARSSSLRSSHPPPSVPLGVAQVYVDDDGFDVLSSSTGTTAVVVGGGPVVPPVVRGRATSSSSSSSSSSSPPPDDCRGRTIYFGIRVVLLTITVGITFVVWISLFGRSVSDDLDPASWVPGFPEGDPNLGSVGEHNRWYVSGGSGGLTLPVLNNLVDGSDWTSYLEGSVSDWDSGTPDAVTLRVRTMDYDPDCRAVRMAMKVCNGDYGPTDWRGVNQVLLQDDYIITSLAKMNDYYLEGTNAAQKQYTMCHELGHGLGLGHSDENFNNLDMGNCMDYTNTPQNNLLPGEYNFLILEELYGNVNGNNNGSSSVSAEEMMSEVPSGNGRRAAASSVDEFETYAAYLLDPIVLSTNGEVGESRRSLSKTKTAEHQERILGNGYSIRTSILLV